MPARGGGNRLALYKVINVSGTWTVVTPASTPETPTAASGTGDALFLFNKIEQSAITFDDNGMAIALDQYAYSQAFTTFLENYAYKVGSSSTTLDPITYEDGVKEGGGAGASGTLILAVSHGAVNPDDSKMGCPVGVGIVEKSSGGVTWKNDQYVKPSVSFRGQLAPGDISVPAGVFDSTLVTGAGLTLTKDLPVKWAWLVTV